MKKTIVLIVFILIIGGCYDYTEIDDLSLITGMIIDYEDNMYKITTQTIENQDKTTTKQYTTKCYSIDECIYKISSFSNKDIFISHLKTLILTENTIINDTDFYDYFLREPKSKMNFLIYYIDNKDKDKLLNLYTNSNSNSLYLVDLTKFNQKIYSSSIKLYFLDYIQKKIDYGITPIYPSISIKDNRIYLDKLVTFNNKKEKIELFNEGIYYNLLKNNINKTILEIPCNNKNYSLEITNSNTKYNLTNSTLNVNTSLKGIISSYDCDFKLDSRENINKLSNLTNKSIEDNINKLIQISKDNDTDFIGLSSYVYKHTNKKLNIKDIKTKVRINTIIESLGEMKNEF